MRSLIFSLLLLPMCLQAAETVLPQAGDCALYREGGEGYILVAPTYYVRGTITEVYKRQHRMELCPSIPRTRLNYTRDDWRQLADAYPCVSDPAKVGEVETIRIRMRVEDWETPWAPQHGRNGMLMKGHFLDTELKQGVELDIDGTLLLRCDP